MTMRRIRLSRREALARVSVMSASLPLLGCVYPNAPQTDPAQTTPWPALAVPEVNSPGYGTDPDLIAPPPSPWPRLLSKGQLDLVEALSEVICPGARRADVSDVIDEWISAPYPTQQADRELILPGLAWLDAHCQTTAGTGYASLSLVDQQRIVAELATTADASGTPLALPLHFFQRLRALVAGAYFSSPIGIRELDHRGNVPIAGDYPGPSAEALDHLDRLLAQLGLKPQRSSNTS